MDGYGKDEGSQSLSAGNTIYLQMSFFWMCTDEVHSVYCQNIDYMNSFIAAQILHFLLNATTIHYAFSSVTNLFSVLWFPEEC